jgi:protein TonB
MPRWLVGVPFSIALHAALAVAIVAFVRGEALPPALIVDLSAIVAGDEAGSPKAAGAPAPSGASFKAARAGESAPSRPQREVSPPAPAVAPASEPVVAPAPVPSEEAPTPSAASTPAQGVPGGTSSGAVAGRSGGGTNPAATGPGGTGTDRIASLGVPGGTGTSTLGIDDTAYLARIRERIQAALRYPAAARRRGVSGTVQLEIYIDQSGAVGAVAVITSSAHEMLDKAAVDAAQSLPRMPLPGGPRAIRVRLPIVFELKGLQ